jgi:hypothetical protein
MYSYACSDENSVVKSIVKIYLASSKYLPGNKVLGLKQGIVLDFP